MYLADPSPLRSGFSPELIYVEIVVVKMGVGVGSCRAQRFFSFVIISSMLPTYLHLNVLLFSEGKAGLDRSPS